MYMDISPKPPLGSSAFFFCPLSLSPEHNCVGGGKGALALDRPIPTNYIEGRTNSHRVNLCPSEGALAS
jgi:hypothetical protein